MHIHTCAHTSSTMTSSNTHNRNYSKAVGCNRRRYQSEAEGQERKRQQERDLKKNIISRYGTEVEGTQCKYGKKKN